MDDTLKEKEIKDLMDDFNKCEYYLSNLNKGDLKYLSDAIDFSNKKI